MIAHTGIVDHVVLVAVAVVAVAVYTFAWQRSPEAPRTHLASWCAGWVALLVALSPPVESAAAETFTGHMIQHLAMIVVAAPLVATARPVRTIVQARHHRRPPMERRASGLARRVGPLAAPLLFVAGLFVTHLTGIYDQALGQRWVHDLEHGAYLGSAVWLWSVIRTGRRADAIERVGSVFAVIAGSALLGIVLLSANTPLVATYAERLGDADALSDQRAAASLMWVGGMATSLPLLIVAFWRWAATEERIALHGERLLDERSTADRGG